MVTLAMEEMNKGALMFGNETERDIENENAPVKQNRKLIKIVKVKRKENSNGKYKIKSHGKPAGRRL